MTLPRELLEAICARPDDRAGYLVAADWLVAKGEPWGELIAAQARLEGETDPGTFLALKRRADALVAQHGDRWLGGAGLTASWRWGFVERLSVPLAELPAVLASDVGALTREFVLEGTALELSAALREIHRRAPSRLDALTLLAAGPRARRAGVRDEDEEQSDVSRVARARHRSPRASATTGSATGSATTGSATTGSAMTGGATTGSTATGSAATESATTGSAATGSAATGSAATESATTGSATTGSAATGSAATGSAATGSAATGSALDGGDDVGRKLDAPLPPLRRLDITGLALDWRTLPSSLTELRVADLHPSDALARWLEHYAPSTFARLELLDLELAPRVVQAVVSRQTALHALHVEDDLPDELARWLAEAPALSKLQHLALGGPATDEGLEAVLTHAARFSRLSTLVLYGGRFGATRRRWAYKQLPRMVFAPRRPAGDWTQRRRGPE